MRSEMERENQSALELKSRRERILDDRGFKLYRNSICKTCSYFLRLISSHSFLVASVRLEIAICVVIEAVWLRSTGHRTAGHWSAGRIERCWRTVHSLHRRHVWIRCCAERLACRCGDRCRSKSIEIHRSAHRVICRHSEWLVNEKA